MPARWSLPPTVLSAGRLLVNSAGVTDRGTILDTSPERFDEIFAVRNLSWGAGRLAEAGRGRPAKGRMLKPDEVARATAFLASEESGMMTGLIIDFDQSVLGCYDAAPQPARLAG